MPEHPEVRNAVMRDTNSTGAVVSVAQRVSPLREQFHILADWWHEATDASSSPSHKVQHRAYQHIIGTGQPFVRFILADLRDRGGYWFYALERITGASPLPKDRPASFAAVKDAWLKWGHDQRLLL